MCFLISTSININHSFNLLLDAKKYHFREFSGIPENFRDPEVRESRKFRDFGNPEISGLRFSGFRESRNFGIEIFGIRDSRTSGLPGIPELRDPEAPPQYTLYTVLDYNTMYVTIAIVYTHNWPRIYFPGMIPKSLVCIIQGKLSS